MNSRFLQVEASRPPLQNSRTIQLLGPMFHSLKVKGQTCADAVEVAGHQVMDPASLELEGTGAVDGRNRGVGLLHPVHQPLDLTVAAERVSPQVSETNRHKQTLGIDPPTPRETQAWRCPLRPQRETGNQFVCVTGLEGRSLRGRQDMVLISETYRSVRMSRCLKRSLGNCCRLLLDRDLKINKPCQ